MEQATQTSPRRGHCRFCDSKLSHSLVDLGFSPLANSYVEAEGLNEMEPFFPLHVWICDECYLAQLEEFETPENIFGDYAYFSSYSDSWLEHCKAYASEMMERFGLGKGSLVAELASNDGYLLQYFKEAGVPVLGIEPAANVAKVAEEKGVETLVRFFGVEVGRELAAAGRRADLIAANNVLAHVPDLNDFVGGMKHLLSDDGVITVEFPHLVRLMEDNQFDTIYHEHFSYFSFLTVERVFSAHGLTLFDVEELKTHGGSLRIYGRHTEDASKPVSDRVVALRAKEEAGGYGTLERYLSYSEQVHKTKRLLLKFLIQAKEDGKTVVGYGAPAKGNTLLNFCGVRTDFIDYTVDRSPHKQNRFLPGVHIPIHSPDMIFETRPDYVLILPWNLKDEIVETMSGIREWGGQFVVPIPEVTVISPIAG